MLQTISRVINCFDCFFEFGEPLSIEVKGLKDKIVLNTDSALFMIQNKLLYQQINAYTENKS